MRTASGIVAASALLVALVCCSYAMAQESIDSRQLNFQLLAAARAGDAAAVERLVHAGASVKTRNRVGATPLLEAARNGHLETATVLIQSGADVNRVDLQLLSPLMHAVYGGHTPLVRLLIENGAQVDLVDRTGKSALVYAAG